MRTQIFIKLVLSIILSLNVACRIHDQAQSDSKTPEEEPRKVPRVGAVLPDDTIICSLTEPAAPEETTPLIRDKILNKYRDQLRGYLNRPSHYCEYEYRSDSNEISQADISSPEAVDLNENVSYTTTNIQEEQVGEADIIQSDGQFIFIANSLGEIEIYSAWPLDEFNFIKQVNMLPEGEDVGSFSSSEFYLTDDKLVYMNNIDRQKTLIHVFDRDGSELKSKFYKIYNQNLSTTRMIEDKLYLIGSRSKEMNYPYELFNNLDHSTLQKFCDQNNSDDMNLWNEKVDEIVEREISNLQIEDEINEQIELFSSCHHKYIETFNNKIESQPYGNGEFVVLSSLDINSAQEDQSCVDSDYLSHIYVSKSSVYLVSQLDIQDPNQIDSASVIHKFNFNSDGSPSYFGTGTVSGRVLNRYSLSEHKGHLRLATTSGFLNRNGNSDTNNYLFVMDANQEDLPIVGSMTDIAPGESIYSARFMGEKGYIVTFKKVDPFFTVDLSDPQNPEIKGELKIPGYSTYLHPLDNNHIIGLGKDAVEAEEGDFAWFQGVKLSLFDVTDFSNPIEEDQEIIGARGTESSALYDPHAFNYSKDFNKLALPVSYLGGNVSGSQRGQFEYDGIHLFDLNSDQGITLDAVIKINEEQECWNNNPITRTIMMGEDNLEVIYALTGDSIHQIILGDKISQLEIELQDQNSNNDFCWDNVIFD